MNDKTVKKLVFSALFAAITCVATMVLRVPVGTAYVHAGDAVVLLAAFLLGGSWTAVAVGLGSALADLVGAYAIYAPATLVVKILVALAASRLLRLTLIRKPYAKAFAAGFVAELIMVAGYFVYELWIIGMAAAVADILLDLLQALFAAAAAAALYPSLNKIDFH